MVNLIERIEKTIEQYKKYYYMENKEREDHFLWDLWNNLYQIIDEASYFGDGTLKPDHYDHVASTIRRIERKLDNLKSVAKHFEKKYWRKNKS